MNEIIITEPPKNCWENGYPIHEGNNKNSLNKTTLYAKQNKIIPNKKRLKKSFLKLEKRLKKTGFKVTVLNFPKELNKKNSPHHDAVFIRDSGLMFKEYWIKANFSATNRQAEAKEYAKIIKEKFNKKIITLPKDALIEFGEVIYLETSKGSFYFGGLSRSNKKGNDFVRNILKPDHYTLIKSKGYHLDTVLAPVINKNNELIAIITSKEMLEKDSFEKLKDLGIKLILVDKKDTCDEDGLGNYAINSLSGEGFIISGSKFTTPHVKKRLKELKIKFYVTFLTDFNFAGGSIHCLTNEIYK